MQRIWWAGLCLALMLTVVSCGPSEPAGAGGGGGKTVIAVIPKGTTHEFWKSVHAGAAKAAQELDIEIIWKGPLKEDDRESQIKVVEDLIVRGVDGICLAPLDDTALRAPVSNAVRKDIPVVIFDSALKSDEYASFVATDNVAAGERGGHYLAEQLGGKGRVVVLRYQEGSASTMNREAGFLKAIAEYPDIEVVSANRYGGATTESAYQASENLLAPYRDAEGNLGIDGIFCPNESTTFGMLRALQDAGWAGKVTFVGFDSSPKLIEALGSGQLQGLVLQDPFNMGYLSVKTIMTHLQGKPVEKRIDTGSRMATPENLATPEIQALVKPDLAQWLGEN